MDCTEANVCITNKMHKYINKFTYWGQLPMIVNPQIKQNLQCIPSTFATAPAVFFFFEKLD